ARAGGARRASAGKPHARGAGCKGRERVRADHAAAEAAGRHRLDRRADRRALTVARRANAMRRATSAPIQNNCEFWRFLSWRQTHAFSNANPRRPVLTCIDPANCKTFSRAESRRPSPRLASPNQAHSPCMRRHLITAGAVLGIVILVALFDRGPVVALMDNIAIFAAP